MASLCFALMMGAGCARIPYQIGPPPGDRYSVEGTPATAEDYNALGVRYELAGQYEKAIHMYQESLALQNDNHLARTNLGNALMKLCRFDEAEKCYRDVLSEAPENLGAMNNLAWLLVSTGDSQDCEEGIELAARCLSLAPQAAPGVRASILDTLAWGNYRLQRMTEALQHIQQAADVLGKEELNRNPLIWGHYHMIAERKETLSGRFATPEPYPVE
jgi:tetratricopeptide (TPR) repeat protein